MCASWGYYSPLVLSPVGILVVGLVCLCVRVSVQTQISVTAGWNFFILGTMMAYGLGMMIIIFFIWSVITDAQTKMSVSEIGFSGKRYTAGCSS